MRIDDTSIPAPPSKGFDFTLVTPDGTAVPRTAEVQTENSVRVYVNGELTMTLMCSADHVADLVIGRLFTEGMIADVDEIEEISICEHATRALVYLKDRSADLSRAHLDVVSTCCTFNKTLNAYFFRDEEVRPVTPIPWNPQDLFALARVFEQDTPIHKSTFSAHSCYLAVDGRIRYCCEDLGRHNAFDKVIGCALRDGVDLRTTTVFTSGRIPTDMAIKAVRSGIPIMVSKAVCTDLTVEMARTYDLTLICSAHSDSMRVFNDPLGCAGKQPIIVR